ncbi:MAG TPA: hypothetical protein VGS13_04380 [Stellaceae bacterium]|nr:hypothetical protein [Stellaceae bacterium]
MHDIAIRGGTILDGTGAAAVTGDYRATLVAGTPVFEDAEDTGARPGRLVRANG